MKIREICEAVRAGKITLDYAGHSISIDKDELLARYDDAVEMENGGNDGNWFVREGEDVNQTNIDMRNHYRRHLDYNVEQEDTLRWGGLHERQQCFNCGEHLHWTLTGDKLQLRNHYEVDEKHKRGYDWVNYPVDYVCPFENPKPFVSQISIESELLITNFFRGINDTPEGKEYDDKFSLNIIAGRQEVAKHKAEQNIAYGQMGNMSIGIYTNTAKDSVIIGPSSHPAEYEEYSSDEEYEKAISKPLFPGYEIVGTICLEMWRWEATDLNTLTLRGVKLDEDQDVVRLDVQKGMWKFQHNYDIIRRTEQGEGEKEFGYVFARLDLV